MGVRAGRGTRPAAGDGRSPSRPPACRWSRRHRLRAAPTWPGRAGPRRPRLTIGLLVLASITIITLDYRGDAHGEIASLKSGASDAFSPVQRGVDAVTHPIGSFLAGAFNGGELEEENGKLRLANEPFGTPSPAPGRPGPTPCRPCRSSSTSRGPATSPPSPLRSST